MTTKSAIWTEKYRPKEFEEVLGQYEIVDRLKAFVEKKNLPHLLFAGPAGVGKSTLALVIARKFFGRSWRENFLELNASDERGIDVVRNKVKDFARTKALGRVPFKIIFLDECDALTRDAQQALRRTMENFTQTCRFILAANYSSKILEPIQSRCAIFRFKLLEKNHLLSLVDLIAKGEEITIDDNAREALVQVAEGDCRRLTNILQSCAAASKSISSEVVYSIASVAQPKEVRSVIELALSNDFISARKKLLELMLNYGLSGLDVIKQVQKEVWNISIGSREKISLIAKCGDVEFRLVEGSDEFIQLEALLAQIALIGSQNS
jgi:replication factor C small subunit